MERRHVQMNVQENCAWRTAPRGSDRNSDNVASDALIYQSECEDILAKVEDERRDALA
jgi:hypothetical protein